MRVSIISFTAAGLRQQIRLQDILTREMQSCRIDAATRYRHDTDGIVRFAEEGMGAWTKAAMEKSDLVLFIGAAGIAVRAIAPFVRDKLRDPAVLVMDERGQFLISLLSGHVGGANAAAAMLAEKTGAIPVITTATDINGVFSADLFAKEHNLEITNRSAIAAVSTKAIEGKPVRICIEGFPGGLETDVAVTAHPVFFRPETLVLAPKRYAVGIGCKKGTAKEHLEDALRTALASCAASGDRGIRIEEVGAITSIDVKMNEPALVELAAKYRLPFLTFTAEVLRNVPGNFTGSSFVEKQVGVDNVCERSAMAAVGREGKLIFPKTSYSGITIAIAQTAV